MDVDAVSGQETYNVWTYPGSEAGVRQHSLPH